MKRQEFFCQGTLGDVFVISCKLFNDELCRIFHRTKWQNWHNDIKTIYNLLLPSAEIYFTDENRRDLIEINSNCHLQTESMEFFPKIPNTLTVSSIFLDVPYIVVQAHAGKLNGGNTKRLSYDTIYKIIDSFDPIKIILIGTDKYYDKVEGCRNMVGMTTIPVAFDIIKHSNGFVGPEGLMSFVALSQKKDSIIFYREKEAISRRVLGTKWEEFCIDLIRMDNDLY